MSFFCQGIYLFVAASNGSNLKLQDDHASSLSGNPDTMAVAATHKVRMNARVEKYASNYIKNNTEALLIVKGRSVGCFDMMDSVFTSYGLPKELKYLAVVESELNPNALSHVGAAGPWQLMPATARILGLKVTSKYDERKYFRKSTIAAARYIKDLYGEFGDWLLVLAAYNGGPGPVYKAIRKSGSHNYWKLQAFLPAETRGHVKRFISIHYFFEGNGSVTTLTRTEMNNYLKTLATIRSKNNPGPTSKKNDISAVSHTDNAVLIKMDAEIVMINPLKLN
jgi:membrane-bound lytic murein transglycosylase D